MDFSLEFVKGEAALLISYFKLEKSLRWSKTQCDDRRRWYTEKGEIKTELPMQFINAIVKDGNWIIKELSDLPF